jgi:transposase
MDREIWCVLMEATREISRCLPKAKRRFEYSECLILRMYLWTVWHDRPLCWACDRAHYTMLFRPRQLPSISQFSRRVASSRFKLLLKILHRRLTHDEHQHMVLAFFDGKALPVNECSKDPDAKTGRGSGRFSRGYKLHALVESNGKVCDYRVRPLNEGEQPIAQRLASSVRAGTCVFADGNYDSGWLYEAVRRRGAQLLTPLRQVPRSPQTVAQMTPGRRAALEAWQLDPDGCHELYKRRGTVERTFAHLTSFAGGLGPLPPWVRRLKRVERWVAAKLCIYHARLEASWTRAA